MPGALTLTKVRAEDREIERQFTFVPSGNYTAGGAIGVAGETLNFETALNPTGLRRHTLGGTFDVNDFEVYRCPSGYDAVLEANAVNPGFTNVVLRFFTSGGTELTGAPTAYPAGLLGQVVGIRQKSAKKNG
jgi:hypothetical protein